MSDKNNPAHFRNILVCYDESAIERSLAIDEESFRAGISELLPGNIMANFARPCDLPSHTGNYELLLLIESFSDSRVVSYVKNFSGRAVFYSLCSQDRFFERVRFLKENNISLLLVSQKRYLQKYHLMDIHGHYLPLLLATNKIRSTALLTGNGLQLSKPSNKFSSSDNDLRNFAYEFFEKQPDIGFDRQVFEEKISEWDRLFRSGPETSGICGIIKGYDDEDLEIDVLHALKAGSLIFVEKRFARLFAGILETGNWMVFESIAHLESLVKEIAGYDHQVLNRLRENNVSLFNSIPYLNTGDTLRYLMFDYPGQYEKVKNSFAQKNIADTYSASQEILKRHPDDPYNLHILGKLALDLGHHEDGEYLLRKSFELDQGIPEVIYALVNIYMNKNREYCNYFYRMLCNYTFACNILSTLYAETLKVPHIEIQCLGPYCKGVGIDVGCGSVKSFKDAVGIDIVPRGKEGKYGSQSGMISDADICGDGADLPCKDNSADYLVSKHNFEHYDDPVSVLKEWIRVVKPDGVLGIVVPDDCFGNSKDLDPTHKQAFTLDGLRSLVKQFDNVSVLKTGQAVPYWSIYCILKKNY